ncbi:uncharacterized protein LOC142358052 [Convolutriloba macropyga]|uniref:uncharacterized protein LOC142358052 n=1 Tax=Convolutriloba macropyga TaxID=536237 RepID=UPI003F524DF5
MYKNYKTYEPKRKRIQFKGQSSVNDTRTRPCCCGSPSCRVPPPTPCACGNISEVTDRWRRGLRSCRSDFCRKHGGSRNGLEACSCGSTVKVKKQSRKSQYSTSRSTSERRRSNGPPGWGKPFQWRGNHEL